MLPILQRLGLEQVILVGQAPPQVAIGRKACDAILPVQVVSFASHVGESPAVIGMHHDQVGFDAAIPQGQDRAFDAAEVLRIEMGEIPVIFGEVHLVGEVLLGQAGSVHGGALIGERLRVPEVVDVVLGEHAEAHLVKVSLVELLQGLGDDLVALVRPNVARRPHGIVGRAVLIGQVMRPCHAHRAVVVTGGRRDGKAPSSFRLGKGTGSRVGVFPFKRRHEAHLVDPIAVIESCRLDGLVLTDKGAFEALFYERIALFRAVYRDLQYIPALYLHGVSSFCPIWV